MIRLTSDFGIHPGNTSLHIVDSLSQHFFFLTLPVQDAPYISEVNFLILTVNAAIFRYVSFH